MTPVTTRDLSISQDLRADRHTGLMATDVLAVLQETGALDPEHRADAHQVAEQLRAITEALPSGAGPMVALVGDLSAAADVLDALA